MVVLTDCLTETPDEGNLKVMTKLIRMIKLIQPDTGIVTYTNAHPMSDFHVEANKSLLSFRLMRFLGKQNEPVLFCPSVARPVSMAIRTAVVSMYCRRRLTVISTMYVPGFNTLASFLIRISGAKFAVLSRDLLEGYSRVLSNEVIYVKAGVDVKKFIKVDPAKKAALRRKYGIAEDKQVILHVGHMQPGRNLDKLLDLDDRFHVLLVTSSYEQDKRNAQLRERLMKRRNISFMEDYISHIEEIYQLADVYFFPVVDEGHCISAPLSVLEAAACNLPVVCTAFGELKQFKGKEGFFFIDSFEPEKLNGLVDSALECSADTRAAVEEYNWDNAASKIIQIVEQQKGQERERDGQDDE